MDCPTNLLSSSDYLRRQRWFNRRARGSLQRHNALISRVEQVACACVRACEREAWRGGEGFAAPVQGHLTIRLAPVLEQSLTSTVSSATVRSVYRYIPRLQRWTLISAILYLNLCEDNRPLPLSLDSIASKQESWYFCLARSSRFEMTVDFLGNFWGLDEEFATLDCLSVVATVVHCMSDLWKASIDKDKSLD